MVVRLYELTDEYKFLENDLDSASSEDVELLKAKLENIKSQIEDKIENIGKFILDIESDVTAIKNEENRLAAKRKSLEAKEEWLKSYTLIEMTSAGIPSIKSDIVTVAVRKSPPSVNIVSSSEVPKEFCRNIPESWEPDKKRILEHFKTTGEVLPGIEMVMDRQHITIK